MVLFLFVVMMLDINVEEVRARFTRYIPIAAIVAGVVVFQLVSVVWTRSLGVDVTQGATPQPADYSNTAELGTVLYTQYVYPFELAAVLLLIAIVAAISLTMRKRAGLKQQDITKQVAVRREDRVRIVQVPAERPSTPRHPRSLLQEGLVHDSPELAADPLGRPVRDLGRGHVHQPQEPHPAADVRRAAAAGGELQLRGVLTLPGRHQRADLRVLRADRGGCR